MDLGTIRTRLQTKHYRTPLEFKDDVDLVWANCAAYNQEGSDARIAGDKCKDVFERAWRDAGIEAQLQAMQDEPDTVCRAKGGRAIRNCRAVQAGQHWPGGSSGAAPAGQRTRSKAFMVPSTVASNACRECAAFLTLCTCLTRQP